MHVVLTEYEAFQAYLKTPGYDCKSLLSRQMTSKYLSSLQDMFVYGQKAGLLNSDTVMPKYAETIDLSEPVEAEPDGSESEAEPEPQQIHQEPELFEFVDTLPKTLAQMMVAHDYVPESKQPEAGRSHKVHCKHGHVMTWRVTNPYAKSNETPTCNGTCLYRMIDQPFYHCAKCNQDLCQPCAMASFPKFYR